MTLLPQDELMTLPDFVVAPFPEIHEERRFTLLEFGNKKNSTGTYRKWYVEHGCYDYVSIDWNGKDGALSLDVNKPMSGNPQLREDGYDVVTNFGFSEHVQDQQSFWRNNHVVCAEDGFLCGVTPAPEFNHWPNHGILQPTIQFYYQLMEANGYIGRVWQNVQRRRFTNCYSWRKVCDNDTPFVWDDAWLSLITPTKAPTRQALRNSGL